MKILVTGGAGFIGRHLVKYLLEKEYSVTIFDSFFNSDKNSISHLIESGAKVVEGDITKPLEIFDATKEHDVVIHLAAKISVIESIKNPSETFRVNVEGTKNVLNACKKNDIKKVIAASSAAVYGEGEKNVKLTEKSETNPISPYGESKLDMENEIIKFTSKQNLNGTILRFFNIYGIGQTPEYAGVITKFIEKISQEKSLEIFGDGLQTRDFIAIQDVINAIHNAILSNKNGIYNIASGESTTINELAEMMILLSEKELEKEFSSSKKGEIRYSQADISMAKKELEYSPKIKLENGIKNLMENRR